MPCALTGHRVSVRLDPERVVIVADQAIVAGHARASDRDHVVYDWQHYLPLIERKPEALRNGAPLPTCQPRCSDVAATGSPKQTLSPRRQCRGSASCCRPRMTASGALST